MKRAAFKIVNHETFRKAARFTAWGHALNSYQRISMYAFYVASIKAHGAAVSNVVYFQHLLVLKLVQLREIVIPVGI